jgi:hypothetical protein
VIIGNICVCDEYIGRCRNSFDNDADNVGGEMEAAMDRVLPKYGYSSDVGRVVSVVGHSELAYRFGFAGWIQVKRSIKS